MEGPILQRGSAAGLLEAIGTRELDDEHYERAIGYPWERRPGSCLVTDEGVEDLADVDAGRREELVRKPLRELSGRIGPVPVRALGADAGGRGVAGGAVRTGYASAKVAGSGPIRSLRSSALIMSISCSERSKSNRSKFSRIRPSVTDFGITTLPS